MKPGSEEAIHRYWAEDLKQRRGALARVGGVLLLVALVLGLLSLEMTDLGHFVGFLSGALVFVVGAVVVFAARKQLAPRSSTRE